MSSSWDVFHSERLEVLRGLNTAEIRAGLASGALRDDDLVRPAGTKDPWARLADTPGLLEPEPLLGPELDPELDPEPHPEPAPPPEPQPPPPPATPVPAPASPRDPDATLVDDSIDLEPPPAAPTIPPWAAGPGAGAYPPPAADEFAPLSDEYGPPQARLVPPRVDPEPGSSKFEFDQEYGPRGERLFEELEQPEGEGLAAFRQWLDAEPPAPPTVEVDTPAAIAAGAEAADAAADAAAAEAEGSEPEFEPEPDPLEEDEAAAGFTLTQPGAPPVEELDLTAMVDVSFQLILFFLVTATAVYLKTLEIPEPNPERTEMAALQPRTIEELESDFILVAIDPAGVFTVDHEPVEPSFNALVERFRAARRDSGRTGMLLTADAQAMHRYAVLVYDAANEVGLRIAIARAAAAADPG